MHNGLDVSYRDVIQSCCDIGPVSLTVSGTGVRMPRVAVSQEEKLQGCCLLWHGVHVALVAI